MCAPSVRAAFLLCSAVARIEYVTFSNYPHKPIRAGRVPFQAVAFVALWPIPCAGVWAGDVRFIPPTTAKIVSRVEKGSGEVYRTPGPFIN